MASPALTALIIDDEPLAREELQYLLSEVGGVSVLGQGTNGLEAVDLIRTHRPDVVFLDVRMPGLDGFAVLRRLLTMDRRFQLPEVVFATAFAQYAVKAFEVNAIDYLLKPFDSKRLKRTLEKVRSRLRHEVEETNSEREVPASAFARQSTYASGSLGEMTAGSGSRVPSAPLEPGIEIPATSRARIWEVAQAKLDALLKMVEEQAAGLGSGTHAMTPSRTGRVVVEVGNRLLLVDQKDVCFARIEDGRITVVTKTLEGASNVRTLEELADQLDPHQFWRAHRSYLVSLQHIREVVPWFKSSYQLRMDDRQSTEIPVSRSQTKRLRELFNL